ALPSSPEGVRIAQQEQQREPIRPERNKSDSSVGRATRRLFETGELYVHNQPLRAFSRAPGAEIVKTMSSATVITTSVLTTTDNNSCAPVF
ncbi:hypothetical protein TSAR_006663, partial [Trichomalopsis sarcophagae]